jgi:hypothetical protein
MAKARDGVAVASTVIARVYRERWGMWTRGVRPTVVSDEDEHALLFGGASAGARVPLDHALRGQEVFDFLTEHGNVIVFLEPVGALLAKAKTLQAETDACFAPTLSVWTLITFLATDPASIAARLGAYRAFCLGRSGLLRLGLLWWSRRDGSPRGGGRVVHCSGRE